MHGPAVASLAIGHDVGAAPGAKLYYVTTWLFSKDCLKTKSFDERPITYSYHALTLEKLVQLNRELAAANKIRVVSISMGFQRYWTLDWSGSRRCASYIPNLLEPADFQFRKEPKLLVPMDNRTYASRQGASSYEHKEKRGLSWAVPYLAGLYALACQVQPSVTPAKFWQAALATGDSKKMLVEGHERFLTTIVNPRRLLARLESGD